VFAYKRQKIYVRKSEKIQVEKRRIKKSWSGDLINIIKELNKC